MDVNDWLSPEHRALRSNDHCLTQLTQNPSAVRLDCVKILTESLRFTETLMGYAQSLVPMLSRYPTGLLTIGLAIERVLVTMSLDSKGRCICCVMLNPGA